MNPHDSGCFCTESLFSAAKRYKTLDFSLIPLNGAHFPQRAKQSAIRWARYQHTPPTTEELHNWFCEQQYAGLGVVCGRISRLLVLDFDDAHEASEFRHLMPDLVQTYTVRSGTRGLPHFYYRLSPGQIVSTQSFGKVDLRGEGAYVVAPPTVVGDACWTVEADCELKQLSAVDLQRLLTYLKGVSERVRGIGGGLPLSNFYGRGEASEFRHLQSKQPDDGQSVGDDLCVVPPLGLPSPNLCGGAEASEFRHLQSKQPDDGQSVGDDLCVVLPLGFLAEASEFRYLTDDDLIECYRQSVVMGRNRALFKVACIARDSGWLEQAVVLVLASVHARQLASVDEPYAVRYAEAVRTIASVYSRPPRRSIPRSSVVVTNAVREWLLTHDLVAAARVLDGLYMGGMKASDLFTERQACQLLAPFRIGRRSVMAALQSEYMPGRRLFEVVDEALVPPLNPPLPANAASGWERLKNSCEMSRGAKRVKSVAMGRKPRLYRLPDVSELEKVLGLRSSGGDVVQPDELSSPKAYRQALHRRLFERRPGQYGRRWLAARLGVSRWTTRRYERAAQVYRQPMYATHVLNWHTAQSLLPETVGGAGLFIEDGDGKRYPPLRAIAFKLLKAGKKVFYRRQEANYFAAQRLSVGIPTLQPFRRGLTRTNPEPLSPSPFLRVEGKGSKSRMDCHETPPQGLSVGIPTLHPVRRGLAAANSVLANLVDTPAQPLSVGIPTLQPSRRGLALTNPVPLNPLHIPPQPLSVGIPTLQPSPRAFWLCPECLNYHISVQPPAACRCGQPAKWEEVPESIWRETERLKQWWQARWHEHHQARRQRQVIPALPSHRSSRLADPTAEACARRLLEQVANLSLATARSLITRYGVAAVEQGVRVLKARDNIHNPAGFLVSLLRSEHKFFLTQAKKTAAAAAVSHMDWVQHMGQSAYVSFLANANDFAVTE